MVLESAIMFTQTIFKGINVTHRSEMLLLVIGLEEHQKSALGYHRLLKNQNQGDHRNEHIGAPQDHRAFFIVLVTEICE